RGRRLQPNPRKRHRLRAPPRAVLTQAHRHHRLRLIAARTRLSTPLADEVVEDGTTMGIQTRVSELPGSRPRGLEARLLRHQLPTAPTRQGNLRSRQPLPLPPITPEQPP